jgi:hypothetical protein
MKTATRPLASRLRRFRAGTGETSTSAVCGQQAQSWRVGRRRNVVGHFVPLPDRHKGEHAWQAQRQAIADEANKKRGDTQRGVTKAEASERAATKCGSTLPDAHKGSDAKATASKTSRGAVERGDKLAKDRPDLAAKVNRGWRCSCT